MEVFMARELYNWEQVRTYSVIALHKVLDSKEKITLQRFVNELNPLQTS